MHIYKLLILGYFNNVLILLQIKSELIQLVQEFIQRVTSELVLDDAIMKGKNIFLRSNPHIVNLLCVKPSLVLWTSQAALKEQISKTD